MIAKSMSQILQEVRSQIEAGWCQGAMYKGQGFDSDGRVARAACLVGAVIDVQGAGRRQDEILRVLARELPPCRWKSMAGEPRARLMNFNDARRRTKQDILGLIDRALVRVTK